MMELENLRKRIDAIDDQLIELFKARMEAAAQIGQYKKQNGLPVFIPQREQEKLEDVAQKSGDEMADYIRSLYRTLFQLSRDYQDSMKE